MIYSCGLLHMDKHRQEDSLEPTYNSSVLIQDVALKTYQKRWTIEKGGRWGSGRSALVSRHYDDIKYRISKHIFRPVSRVCWIHQLHLCWTVGIPQRVSLIWHKTIWWWLSMNAGALGNAKCPFIAIALRSTLTGVVIPDRLLSMGQIELNPVLMLNWIVWNRTVYIPKLYLALITNNGWCAIKTNQTKPSLYKDDWERYESNYSPSSYG